MLEKKDMRLVTQPTEALSPILIEDDHGESLSCEDLWDSLWETYGQSSKAHIFPRPMAFLNGAPGSGKGANTQHVMRALGITSSPLVVSHLLASAEQIQRKNRGELIDSKSVIHATFPALLRGGDENGLIVDGFPRALQQAKFLHLLESKSRQLLGGEDPKFKIVVFSVDEATSVERQLIRGRKAIAHNQEVKHSQKGTLREVRSTDLDESLARQRYRAFINNTDTALRYLQQTGIPFIEIDSRGSFESVKKRIEKILTK